MLLTAKRVQYIDEVYYDYLIHSASVSHTRTDDTRMRSSRHYMKILEMLDAINKRYPEQVKRVPACHWQIAKEGLGILHSINNIDDMAKREITRELFDRGIWTMIWQNARGFRQRWRLGRRYFRLKNSWLTEIMSKIKLHAVSRADFIAKTTQISVLFWIVMSILTIFRNDSTAVAVVAGRSRPHWP